MSLKIPEQALKGAIRAAMMLGLFAAPVPVTGGINVSAYPDIEQALGVELTPGTFAITTNTLAFGRADLEYFSGGTIEAPPYTLTAIPGTPQFSLFDQQSGLEYRIENAHIGSQTGRLFMMHGDIMATTNSGLFVLPEGAESLVIGEINLDYPVDSTPPPPPPGVFPWCPTNYGPSIDVELFNISSVQQVDREPGVRISMGMSTFLRNIGTNDVIWQWSILPPGPHHPLIGQHPYAVFHLYRIKDGSIRQIGKSDVKHAFFSVNSVCDCPGAQVMFAGCADVYGMANNTDPYYFTPRDEVHVHSGSWNSSGSWFDVTAEMPVADDYRSRTNWPDEFVHMLVVPEALLGDTGAQYYVESWYPAQGDTNIYNNMGYREVTPSFTNGIWSFAMEPTYRNGPVLSAFIGQGLKSAFSYHQVLDTQEGMVHVAVKVTPLGSGMYRYGYALMNLSFDRRLDELRVPVSPSAVITNVAFGDADIETSNDWNLVHVDDELRWTASGTNALIWGSTLEFVFESDVPPSPSPAGVSAYLPGPSNEFAVATLAPGIEFGSISVDGTPEITWPSVSGAVYRVETAGGELPPAWADSGLVVTGGMDGAILNDSNALDGAKLYRLKLLSAP